MLDVLGVGDVAQRVYRALLTGPSVDAAVLSRQVDEAPATVEAALRELHRARLVTASTQPSGYSPVDPEVALNAVVGRERDALRERERQIDDLLAHITEFRDLFHVGQAPRSERAGLWELVSTEDEVNRRLDELTIGASELMVFARPPMAGDLQLLERDADLLERGGTLRTVYDTALLGAPRMWEFVQASVEAGEHARTSPAVPIKLVIVDRRCAVVPVDSASTARLGAVITRVPSVVLAFVRLFDLLWDNGVPLVPGRGVDAADTHELDGELAQLLPLLAAGMTDAVIAERLGLGLRTVRRRISRLMDLAPAQGRFQLGLQAARRGWL